MAFYVPIQQQKCCQKDDGNAHNDIDDGRHDVHGRDLKAFVDPIQQHSGSEDDHSKAKDHRHNVFHRSEVHNFFSLSKTLNNHNANFEYHTGTQKVKHQI